MAIKGAPRRDLLYFATSTALGAIGLAAVAHPPAAAALVATLVGNLATNYGAAKIDPLLGSFSSEDWLSTNFDLDRVAEHAFLTILYETLIDNKIDPGEAKKTVKAAGDAWDLRIFRDASPNEDDLIAYLREPGPMPLQQAELLAQQILIRHKSLYAAYSQALSERFARTFEILLRSDQRAYRAAIVYLQRFSLGELKSLRTELTAGLDLLTRPQPVLERYKNVEKEGNTPSITDLQFRRRAILYRPREPLDRSLTEWLESEDPFRILKITGPAGMGKSRLALELCDKYYRKDWLAGFVRSSKSQQSDWPQPWTPNRDTLAVLDYAGSKSIGGQPAFEWLKTTFLHTKPAKANGRGRPPRVRIVLLDRTDQGALWSDWGSSELATDLDQLTLPVALDPDRAEFDAIVNDEFRRRKDRDPSAAENHAIEVLAERLRGQFRPLFASLTAAAVADLPQGSTQSWSPELLIQNVLNAQKSQWKTAGITDADLDLLFEATLTQGSAGPDWEERVELLTPATLAALANLSEPDALLGPIAPDLLGEFFILMRLCGEATTEARLRLVNTRTANEIVARSWQSESATTFIGRLLEDYLDWVPQDHSVNPANELMDQALSQVLAGRNSFGLRYCCFAAAWKKPSHREWAVWLREASGGKEQASEGIVAALATGLYNATVGEPDPAKSLALAERIEKLHEGYGHEPAVREKLAQALSNARVVEPDPAKSLALAERIEKLHEGYGHEPAVREQLASALYNATVGEPDPAKRLALAERIEKLHDGYGHEPAARELLAKALSNATVVEPDPAKRLALAERIEKLHDGYGHEPAVREQLAKALYNATVGEPDPAKRLALAERIEKLHDGYGHEPAVRELLASALYNATVVEPDPAKRLALAERIEKLHEGYGHEPAVREQLAKALYNATVGEPDPAKSLALAERIEKLHEGYGHEPAVREKLAQALSNARVVEPDPAKSLALAERIEKLHEGYGHEPAVREQLASALYNATVGEPDPAKRLALAERIEKLHDGYGHEPAARELLAKALFNATVVEPDPAKSLALAERIEKLHEGYGHEPAVREQLASALYNATVGEPDPAKSLALAERIEKLHDGYGHEPAVRELLAKALSNATVVEPDPAQRAALITRLEHLVADYPGEPNLALVLARARAGE